MNALPVRYDPTLTWIFVTLRFGIFFSQMLKLLRFVIRSARWTGPKRFALAAFAYDPVPVATLFHGKRRMRTWQEHRLSRKLCAEPKRRDGKVHDRCCACDKQNQEQTLIVASFSEILSVASFHQSHDEDRSTCCYAISVHGRLCDRIFRGEWWRWKGNDCLLTYHSCKVYE